MSRQIHVGGVPLGGGAPVSIQSMTNTPTHNVEATLCQIRTLAAAVCDFVRIAMPDLATAMVIGSFISVCSLLLNDDFYFYYYLSFTYAD